MKNAISLFLAILFVITASAQSVETPDQRAKRMSWWKEAKFGLFIHWGIYSVAAGEYNGQKNYGEWLMNEARISVPEYEKFAPQFNPVQFDADEWVRLARNAGMKYIVITSKHHDGFSMFNSAVSDYDIADRTPFQRDPMAGLATACRKYGLKLCFYHSIMDWHHPKANKEGWAAYRDNYMYPQLKELLTNYGDIGVLWFDGEWIDEWTEEQGKELYRYVRSIQPDLIVNNRVGKGRNGMQGMNTSDDAAGDFGTPEQEILGEKSDLDWESCMTMNNHWGYNKHDKNFKSADELIWNIADITAKGGNFLLNIGPTAQGTFPPECVQRLETIGQWMSVNGASVHGAHAWAHWQEGDDIRYSSGGKNRVFVTFRGQETEQLLLRKIRPKKGSRIDMLGCDEALVWKQTPEGVIVQLPPLHKRPLNTLGKGIWVLQINGTPVVVPAAPRIGTDPGSSQKTAVFTGKQAISMTAEQGVSIHYTTDGSEPTASSPLYAGQFEVNRDCTIRAIARNGNGACSEPVAMKCVRAKYGIRLQTSYAEKYGANGPSSLIDQERGSIRFTDGKWLGYEGVNSEIILDLGENKRVLGGGISCLRLISSWIFLPVQVDFLASSDGSDFKLVKTVTPDPAVESDADSSVELRADFDVEARYIKIIARNQGVCPAWHAGAGGKSWLFVDETWLTTNN
ncbi:MAG: alpha-L-fucosidase [Bacteroidota bacterium]